MNFPMTAIRKMILQTTNCHRVTDSSVDYSTSHNRFFLLNALLEILFLFHNKFEFLKSFLVYVCENNGVTDLFSLLHGLDMIEFFFWYNVLEHRAIRIIIHHTQSVSERRKDKRIISLIRY